MNIILHIGLPKTGSSSFQAWVDSHSDALKAIGIGALSAVAAHRIATEYLNDPRRTADRDIADIAHMMDLAEAKASLCDMVTASDLHTVLISSEYFYIADPIRIGRFFSRAGLRVTKLLAVLRRQDRLIASGYNQDVKSLGEASPYILKGFEHKYDFVELIESWRKALSFPDICLHNFDLMVRDRRVISTVAEDIGAESLLDPHDDMNFHVNDGLTAEMVKIVRMANGLGLHGIGEIAARAQQNGLTGTPFRLPRQVRDHIAGLYRDSNRRLIKMYGAAFDGFLNDDDSCDTLPDDTFPLDHTLRLLAFATGENKTGHG